MRRLGRVAKRRGRLGEALEWYRRGFEIADAQRDREGMVVACQGVGNVLVDQGRWAAAGEWYQRGLEIYRPELPARLLWQLHLNLSIVARRTGDLEASRRWLDRARETVEASGDQEAMVYVRNAEGLTRVAAGDLVGAERAYQEAMSAGGGPASRATVLINLAECLVSLGRIGESERVARELERLVVVNRLLPFLPHVYRGLGAVTRERRDEEGFLFYEQALALTPEADEGLAFERALTQEEYGRFEARLGRLGAAAARLEEAGALLRRLGAEAELERVRGTLTEVLERIEAGEAGTE
jgi:tetratricopeptide (TPR) repeat protein